MKTTKKKTMEFIFFPHNLKSIKRYSDRHYQSKFRGQFWQFSKKWIELWDKNGLVKKFNKKSIQFASNGNEVILGPRFIEAGDRVEVLGGEEWQGMREFNERGIVAHERGEMGVRFESNLGFQPFSYLYDYADEFNLIPKKSTKS